MDQLIAAKLFQPKPTFDFIQRDELFQKLDKGAKCNITLVSAPAGYGKSVTVSGWLERCNKNSAWIAFSRDDNDFTTFINYLIAAIDSLEPGLCSNTHTLILNSHPLPKESIIKQLTLDIQSLRKKAVLVLDDIGFLHKTSIFELLEQVILHSPQNLHLVLITRRDPPLSLHRLRMSGSLIEIRHSDLKFRTEDIIRFFQTTHELTIDYTDAKVLLDKLEGWPAGMRMVSISLKEGELLSEILVGLSGDSRDVKDYLINEVLDRQLPSVRKTLLKSSILRKFDTELCDLFCTEDISGNSFVEHLVMSNIFIIKVSPQNGLYRYHHLFQDLLQQILQREFTSDEIAILHRKAADWYSKHDHLEEALFHYSEIGDEQSALNLLEEHRHDLMNKERWNRLDHLLGLLPEKITSKSLAMLITKAFLAENRFLISNALEYIDKVEQVCAQKRWHASDVLLAEKDSLLTMKYYLQNNPQEAIKCGLRAIDTLPDNYSSVLGFAYGLTAFSFQMQGKCRKSLDLLSTALQISVQQKSTLHGRLLLTLCFMYWFEGDLENLKHAATKYDEFAASAKLPEAIAFSRYFLSIEAYQVNRLPEAERYLLDAKELANNINITAVAHNTITLAKIQYESGQVDKAMKLIDELINKAYDLGNIELQMISNSFRVDLEIREGRKRVAEKWLRQVRPIPLYPVYRMYSPCLTEIRALLVQETEDALNSASERLYEMIAYFRKTHQTPMLIELYSLLAKLYEQTGRGNDAEKALLEAILLSSPGRFINIFSSISVVLPSILKRLQGKDINPQYYNLLLSTFGSTPNNGIVPSSIEFTQAKKDMWKPLSNREMEILYGLSKRLSNKEIANELYISVSTVKRHVANIYQKLEVHSRLDAVNRAQKMGLLGLS